MPASIISSFRKNQHNEMIKKMADIYEQVVHGFVS
jgi:hypothetical protein